MGSIEPEGFELSIVPREVGVEAGKSDAAVRGSLEGQRPRGGQSEADSKDEEVFQVSMGQDHSSPRVF